MLYPQANQKRQVTNLNGIWNFTMVPEHYQPTNPLIAPLCMSVPSSYNDVTVDKTLRDHVGKVCYEREFAVHEKLMNETIRLRIGAASHIAEVYINGAYLTLHNGGFLPIDIDITANVQPGMNRLSVVVDNRLTFQTLPIGEVITKEGILQQNSNHDFYNYAGIHRDVLLYTVPKRSIEEIAIETESNAQKAVIRYQITTEGTISSVRILDLDHRVVGSGKAKTGSIELPNPHRWDIGDGYLYQLVVETDTDVYTQPFGIRDIKVTNGQFLLNGKPVYFKGFGKHEDIAVIGKGNNAAYNIRDFNLLQWIGANSFRTSHYPYAEEIYDLADRYGILVIDEIPAVGLNFWSPRQVFCDSVVNKDTVRVHQEQLKELIQRDKNHPSVVMISVGNEANTQEAGAYDYWKEVIAYTRKLTKLPITLVEWVSAEMNKVATLVDVIGINRYVGWYTDFADLSVIAKQLPKLLQDYHDKFQKPLLLSEFGADTMAGFHSLPSVAFSEEFQVEFVDEYRKAIKGLDFVMGEHIWNFADFLTKQGLNRFGGNKKGVFTRDRQPKMIAHYLRKAWNDSSSQ